MIRILCFGDSNTWGTIADGSFKHCNIEHSYPSILQKMFKGATKKSEKFNDLFKQIATKNNCLFINNNGLECGNDGLHLTPNGLSALAQKVFDIIVNN